MGSHYLPPLPPVGQAVSSAAQGPLPGQGPQRRGGLGPSLAGRWSETKARGPHEGLFSQELPRRGVRP